MIFCLFVRGTCVTCDYSVQLVTSRECLLESNLTHMSQLCMTDTRIVMHSCVNSRVSIYRSQCVREERAEMMIGGDDIGT